MRDLRRRDRVRCVLRRAEVVVSYSIGHTLITPLPDGRVSYTPCRHCGDPCRGHSMAGRIEMQEVPVGAWCRTCGAECPRAQCDACRADGAALALERSACGHLVAEIEGREGSTRWCAGCEREARVREEAVEAAARVAEDACDDPPWAIAERIRALAGDRPR